MKVAIYISSHGMIDHFTKGYGHSTRAATVIFELARRGHKLYLMTAAPLFLFKDSIAQINIRQCALLDPPLIHNNAFEINVAASLKNIQKFLLESKHFITSEVDWLKEEGIDIVYADVPPFPILAAKHANIPAVIVSNFTFDAIYADFATASSSDQEIQMIKSISLELREMYSKATYLIRIPGYIPMPKPERKMVDVELLTRISKTSKNITREQFDIPLNCYCLFVTLGGFDIQNSSFENQMNDRLPDGWYCLIASPSKTEMPCNTERIKFFTSKDWYIPDIIEASDVVLGKLGYGTCAEMVSHNKPFIYVPRPLFCEQEGLLSNLMIPFGRCMKMTQLDFDNGNWTPYILEALQLPSPKKSIAFNGHEQVANIFENIYHENQN